MKIVPQLQVILQNVTRLTIPPYSSASNSCKASPCIQTSSSLLSDSTNKQATVKPSTLMSSRGRPLPKFGVVKECAGCGQRIYSVHEEAPGPKASRWHKKCLVCQGCSKKLDSGATVYQDEETAKLSLCCTTCLVSSYIKGSKVVFSLSLLFDLQLSKRKKSVNSVTAELGSVVIS